MFVFVWKRISVDGALESFQNDMDTCKSNLNKSSSISRKSPFVYSKKNLIMESAFVRYLRTRLFSQNPLARKASLVRFMKTNSCLNIVRQHFPWRNLYILAKITVCTCLDLVAS